MEYGFQRAGQKLRIGSVGEENNRDWGIAHEAYLDIKKLLAATDFA
jgi:hypothetical protein